MMLFKRYPHVKELLEYYSSDMSDSEVDTILKAGVKTEQDAEALARFIWKMADKMSEDSNEEKPVLGRTDNSDMLPDVEYEITLQLANAGMSHVWDRVSDEENPE